MTRFRSFTRAGNFVGQKVVGVCVAIIIGYLVGTKMQYTAAQKIMREIEEQERLKILKEIKDSGIVERMLEKEDLETKKESFLVNKKSN
jgi:glycerol uptake facilitator-like aquaporin